MALLIKGLAGKGYRVSVIDFMILNDLKLEENIEIISLHKKCHNDTKFGKLMMFYRLLVNVHADFYYARIRTSIHLIAYYAAKKNKAKFIIGLASDLDASTFYQRLVNFYTKRSLFVFIKHLFHTEIVFNYLLHHANHIFSQHHGQVDALRLRGIKSTIMPNVIYIPSNILNHHSDFPYYVSIGSLDRRKGLPYFVTICNSCFAIQFKVIGRCRDNYSKTVMSVLSRQENLIYLGSQSHNEVLQIISGASFLISTSPMEGFPNTFLEAWLYGIPVLSLFVDPGNIIEDNRLGVCFHGDIADMISFINNPDKKFDHNKIKEYVIKNHDPIKGIDRFLEGITSEN